MRSCFCLHLSEISHPLRKKWLRIESDKSARCHCELLGMESSTGVATAPKGRRGFTSGHLLPHLLSKALLFKKFCCLTAHIYIEHWGGEWCHWWPGMPGATNNVGGWQLLYSLWMCVCVRVHVCERESRANRVGLTPLFLLLLLLQRFSVFAVTPYAVISL